MSFSFEVLFGWINDREGIPMTPHLERFCPHVVDHPPACKADQSAIYNSLWYVWSNFNEKTSILLE